MLVIKKLKYIILIKFLISIKMGNGEDIKGNKEVVKIKIDYFKVT